MKEAGNMINLNTIISLAKREAWEEVNRLLPQHADQQEFFDWARESLGDSDSNLRDLAASILEQTNLAIDDSTVEDLFGLMGEADENNPYPSFRAACALAKRHGDESVLGRIDEVKGKLQSFIGDEDVAEIAKSYLEIIRRSKNS